MHFLAHRVRDDRGFTLIEMLVALTTGLVVTFAAFTILIISSKQAASIEQHTEADQTGRATMAKIVNILRTGCLANEFAPVQEGSTATKLIVDGGPSRDAAINNAEEGETAFSSGTSSSEAFQNRITWEEVEKEGVKVPVFSLERTASVITPNQLPGEFKYTGTKVKARLGEYDTKTTNESKTLPVFSYYEYNSKPSPGTPTEAANDWHEIEVGNGTLTSSEAGNVAAVKVSFTSLYGDNNTKLTSTQSAKGAVPFSTLVALSLGLPSSESTITDGPCQ